METWERVSQFVICEIVDEMICNQDSRVDNSEPGVGGCLFGVDVARKRGGRGLEEQSAKWRQGHRRRSEVAPAASTTRIHLGPVC